MMVRYEKRMDNRKVDFLRMTDDAVDKDKRTTQSVKPTYTRTLRMREKSG